MRLIELSMSAFGPYRSPQIIDFTKINDLQLFLVTGPTGAGKTSIFDAISYALFGNSSGNERDGDSLRSDYASYDDETYVSLIFEIKGIKYSIKRSPKQERRKVKGEGTTIKSAEAILEFNHRTYTGVNEVNQKVQEILGIDYHQFRQIVMLPQGEFRKLLEASSQDRADIFRKLFKTEDFLALQERLKERSNQLKNEIGDVYKLLENHIQHIECDEESELGNCIYSSYKDYDSIIRCLNEKIDVDHEALNKVNHLISNEEKDILSLTSTIEKAEATNQNFKKREALIETQESLQIRKNDIKAIELKVKKAQSARNIYIIEEKIDDIKVNIKAINEKKATTLTKIQTLQSTIETLNEEVFLKEKEVQETKSLNEYLFSLKDKYDKYQIYEEKEKELNLLFKEKEKLEKEIKDKEKDIETLHYEFNQMKNNHEEIQNISALLPELQLKEEGLKNSQKNNAVLLEILEEAITKEEKHRILSKSYQREYDEYKQEKTDYEQKFQSYLLGQAGIIAKSLQANEPCPVCGSTQHPKIASIKENVPSIEKLDVLKSSLEIKQQKTQKTYQQVLSLNQEINEKKALYKKLGDLSQDDINTQDEIEHVKKVLADEKAHLNIAQNRILEIKEKLEKQKELENKIKEKETFISEGKAALEKLKLTFVEVKNKEEVKKEALNELKESIKDYEDKNALEKEMDTIDTKIKTIHETYQKLLEKRDSSKNELLVLETNLNNIKESNLMYETNLEKEMRRLEEQLKINHFKDIDDYKTYLFDEETIKSYTEAMRNYDNEVSYVAKTLKELNEVLKGEEIINVLEMKDRLSSMQEKLKGFRNEYEVLSFRIQNNLKILNDMNRLLKKVKKRIEEYEILSDLSKAANGDNSQKLTFERFVLAAYFDEIINAANIRLSEMTNNRYFLCRKEEKGKGGAQQGLDLEVVDNYTSKNRLVKTLSGGEAFIASLSLALGLADVVQSYSGGIELDTIFIDEGFGSLDPESLELAITTLVGIQKKGRLVGIISHVQELKERIDVKLEITPSQSGSCAKIVL